MTLARNPAQNSILLIEDSEDDYEAVARSFKKAELSAALRWCRTGDEAVAALKQDAAMGGAQLPQLILLDLNMPGLDGRQTLEIIKQDPDLQQIPVVIFTTSANERDIRRCYQAGASSYIQKPVGFEKMIQVARTLKEYWLDLALLPSASMYKSQ